jgi:hypothetical protein
LVTPIIKNEKWFDNLKDRNLYSFCLSFLFH